MTIKNFKIFNTKVSSDSKPVSAVLPEVLPISADSETNTDSNSDSGSIPVDYYRPELAENKNKVSGQLEFLPGGELREERPRKCAKVYSAIYWRCFSDFLNASGVFSRTIHLYYAVKDEPRPEELERFLSEVYLEPQQRKETEEELERLSAHYHIMRESYHCDTPKGLVKKAAKDWQSYEHVLKELFRAAVNARVPHYVYIVAPKNDDGGKKSYVAEISSLFNSPIDIEALSLSKQLRDIMISFYSLDDRIRGAARRQYYREKFIKPALKELQRTGYADPISFREMEKAFKSDKKWQSAFLASQARKAAKKRQTTTSPD